MTTFDPKAEREKNKDQGVPAGDYLIVMRGFDRKTSKKSGQDYLRARFMIIAGQAKKKTFFDSVSLDISNSGTAFRLSMLAEGCGQTESFNLEDDAELRRIFLNKPFKVRVSRKLENGYVNNGIERYLISEKDVSSRERELMDVWMMEAQEEEDMGQGDGGPPIREDDEFYGGGRGGGSYGGGDGGSDPLPFATSALADADPLRSARWP